MDELAFLLSAVSVLHHAAGTMSPNNPHFNIYSSDAQGQPFHFPNRAEPSSLVGPSPAATLKQGFADKSPQ